MLHATTRNEKSKNINTFIGCLQSIWRQMPFSIKLFNDYLTNEVLMQKYVSIKILKATIEG